MQEQSSASQGPQSPRSVLPPLSKYYYGPAQGSASPQRVHHEDGWGRGSSEATPPALPPRHTEVFSASQWMNHFASTEQLWQLPGPPASAPPSNHVQASSYNPSTYRPISGARPSVVPNYTTATPERRSEESSWDDENRHGRNEGTASVSKPPLPPRPYGQVAHGTTQNGFQQISTHASGAASVDFLPSVAYNAAGLSSVQQFSQGDPYHHASPPPPQRVPPPPPPKLPPDYDERSHEPDSSEEQQSHSSGTLNEGQRQYERFRASQKDSVTYSIPSSIWRQDPPTVRTQAIQPASRNPSEHEEHNHYGTSQKNSDRPLPPLAFRARDHGAAATGHFESQDVNGTPSDKEQSEQRGKDSQFPLSVSNEFQQQSSMIQARNSGRSSKHSRNATAESVGWGGSGTEQQRSDSFYWQSPHSSVHSTSEEGGRHSAEATPLDKANDSQRNPFSVPGDSRNEPTDVVPPMLSHSNLGSYSASALGFGGPSDWEHFGDYEAEDIDDTDLYLRPKSPIQSTNVPETAELHAESTHSRVTTTDYEQQIAQNVNGVETDRPSEEYAGKARDEEPSGEATSPPHQLNYVSRDALGTEVDDGQVELSHRPVKPSQAPPSIVDVSSPISDAPSKNTFSTDLDETIRAWSRADSTENLIDTSSTGYSTDQRSEAGSKHGLEFMKVTTVRSEESLPPTAGPPSPGEERSEEASALRPHDAITVAHPVEEVNNDQQEKPRSGPLESLGTTHGQQERDEISDTPATNARRGSESIEQAPIANQSKFPPTKGPPSKTQDLDDPFSSLDAWGKASLNRYIAMLREESQAKTDKEKFNIFNVFTSRETRLRAVLYDADQDQSNDPDLATKANPIASPIKRASTTSYKRASKALPALPEDANTQISSDVKGHSRKLSKKFSAAAVLGNPKPALQSLETDHASATDDLYVMVESPGSVRYSPGGRPVVPRPPTANNSNKEVNDLSAVAVDSTQSDSPKDDRSDVPIPNTPDQSVEKDEAPYVAFKYNGGRSEAQNYAANRLSKRQSVLRPYSKMMGFDEYREIFPNGMDDPEDIPQLPANDITSASKSGSNQVQLDLRRFVRSDFDPLLSVLPAGGEVRPEALPLSDLRGIMDSVPDDFGFIHQSVIAWDTKAKRQRESNERERHARQVESEQRIDALFDDHEIGYGDISELESGFKRSEAARKADEDRGEYQTFVSEVFDVVWTRLHYEIDQLTPHYRKHTELLDDTTAGKDMFDPSSDRFALAPTMDSLLTLHQKLEIRHQKAFEAVLERDRRLKKVELSPWYSLGNVAKVKQLEKQFEVAEKKAILDYCRQRDIRANSLMDHLDQNTLRGVGANQDYMEMVMKAVRRIASGRAFASQPGSSEPGVGLEEVTKAKSITKVLSTSSEQIVQTFHVADMLLNAADYELSVAKARLEGADVGTFQKLKEEKAKEDQKLMRDLEHRLALIREDSRRTHDEIVKLLLFLGVQSGHAGSSPSAAKPADVEHQERIQKALEEAKKRNAAVGANAVGAV